MRIPVYLCPSEINDRVRVKTDGTPHSYPLNYAFNFGIWFVWDPATGRGGEGVFHPNSRYPVAAITDGLSNTLMATEVKASTPYSRNLTGVSARPPRTPGELAGLVLAAPEKKLGPNTNDNTCTSGRHALSRMHNPHDRTNLDAPVLQPAHHGACPGRRGGNSCAGFPISPLDRFLR